MNLLIRMAILSVVLASRKISMGAAFQTSSAFLARPSCSSSCVNRMKSGFTLAVSASDWTTQRGMSTDAKHDDEDDNENLLLDPLIVCGPSGVGKGTIIERFMSDDEFGGHRHFGFTTSHTTRAPREGEVDKVHYNFVSKEKMKSLIEEGKFLESALVHGNYYGTSWESLRQVQRSGKRCLLDIDVQGVKRVKALEDNVKHNKKDDHDDDQQAAPYRFQPKYIFIAPVDFESLRSRLAGRGTESAESLEKRTQNAKEEVEYGLTEGNFDYVLVNDDLDTACQEFSKVVKDMYGIV